MKWNRDEQNSDMVNHSPLVDDNVIYGTTDLTNYKNMMSPLFSSTEHRTSDTEGDEDQLDEIAIQKMLDNGITKVLKRLIDWFHDESELFTYKSMHRKPFQS